MKAFCLFLISNSHNRASQYSISPHVCKCVLVVLVIRYSSHVYKCDTNELCVCAFFHRSLFSNCSAYIHIRQWHAQLEDYIRNDAVNPTNRHVAACVLKGNIVPGHRVTSTHTFSMYFTLSLCTLHVLYVLNTFSMYFTLSLCTLLFRYVLYTFFMCFTLCLVHYTILCTLLFVLYTFSIYSTLYSMYFTPFIFLCSSVLIHIYSTSILILFFPVMQYSGLAQVC